MKNLNNKNIAHYAALQSVSEIGIGSFVHGTHLPLGGHFLSLNQAAVLTFAVRNRTHGGITASSISFIASILKLLSPAGQKLMPAIAIGIQGLLYTFGIILFGTNLIGVIAGAVALSLWAFIHPLVFTYLLFGETLLNGIVKIWTEITKKLNLPVELGVWILISVVILKILLAMGVAIFSWRASPETENRYFEKIKKFKMMKKNIPRHQVNAFAGALSDLMQPFFIFSLFFSLFTIIIFNRSNSSIAFAYLLKTVLGAAFIFFTIRVFPKSWANVLLNRFPALKATFDRALESTQRSH